MVRERNGKFWRYIDWFKPYSDRDSVEKLVSDLTWRFERFGDISARHFVQQFGLPMVKPDLNLARTFHRIGLIDDENDTWGAVDAAWRMAEVAEVPVNWVDDFAFLGMKDLYSKGSEVCGTKPKCSQCEIGKLCRYYIEHH